MKKFVIEYLEEMNDTLADIKKAIEEISDAVKSANNKTTTTEEDANDQQTTKAEKINKPHRNRKQEPEEGSIQQQRLAQTPQ